MGFYLNGQVSIPGEEFWEWIYQELPAPIKESEPYPLSVVMDARSMDSIHILGFFGGDNPKPIMEVDPVLFWDFVRAYVPELKGEHQFGVPRDDDPDLVIAFSCSTENLSSRKSTMEPKNEWEKVRSRTNSWVVIGKPLDNPGDYVSNKGNEI